MTHLLNLLMLFVCMLVEGIVILFSILITFGAIMLLIGLIAWLFDRDK